MAVVVKVVVKVSVVVKVVVAIKVVAIAIVVVVVVVFFVVVINVNIISARKSTYQTSVLFSRAVVAYITECHTKVSGK